MEINGMVRSLSWVSIMGMTAAGIGMPAVALPPPDDVPEEILQTEIITDARSPLNGEPLTAAEYAELVAELQDGPDIQPDLAPEVEYIIYLLHLRQAVRSVFPFLLQ